MPDRAELRRQARALRKLARRSPFHTPVADGIAPLPGSAGVRARELFIQAAETGKDHPYAGLSRAQIRDIEHERRPIPNRTMARKYGIRSGYSRRLAQRLAMGAEIQRADAIDESPQRKAAHDAARAKAGDRQARRLLRHLAFRQRQEAAREARAAQQAAA